METQKQETKSKPAARMNRTSLFLLYRTAAGEQCLYECTDKGELDAFLENNEVQPLGVIRGKMKSASRIESSSREEDAR